MFTQKKKNGPFIYK